MSGGMEQPDFLNVQWAVEGAPILDDTTFEYRFRGARMQLRRRHDPNWVEITSIEELPDELKKLGRKKK